MEGWNTWRRRILAALGGAGLMFLAVPVLRADLLPSAVATDSVVRDWSEAGSERSVQAQRTPARSVRLC